MKGTRGRPRPCIREHAACDLRVYEQPASARGPWPGDPPPADLLGRFLPIFTDFYDFLGRLQPSKTGIQETPDALGVEESSSPRRVLHFQCSNSSGSRVSQTSSYPAARSQVQSHGSAFAGRRPRLCRRSRPLCARLYSTAPNNRPPPPNKASPPPTYAPRRTAFHLVFSTFWPSTPSPLSPEAPGLCPGAPGASGEKV